MDPDLGGRRVVLTQQRADRLADRLRVRGLLVEHVALTEPGEPSDGGAGLREALARLERFDWLVVTSVNGARAVGPSAATVPQVRLATVGAATAAALEHLAGRRVDLVPEIQRVDGLLDAFRPALSAVLVAQGDLASPSLVDGLRARGHDVTAVQAYSTVARPPSEADVGVLRAADVVVLASGSAATVLARACGALTVVAIGPVTAEAAQDAGLVVASTAPSPAAADVADAIVAALR